MYDRWAADRGRVLAAGGDEESQKGGKSARMGLETGRVRCGRSEDKDEVSGVRQVY